MRRERMVQCEAIIVRCEEAEGARSRPRYELSCYFSDVAGDDMALIEQYVGWRSLRRLPAAPKATSPTPARKPVRPAAKASRKVGSKKVAKAAKPAAKKRPVARKPAAAAKKKRRN